MVMQMYTIGMHGCQSCSGEKGNANVYNREGRRMPLNVQL